MVFEEFREIIYASSPRLLVYLESLLETRLKRQEARLRRNARPRDRPVSRGVEILRAAERNPRPICVSVP